MPRDTSTLPLTVDNTGFLLDKLGEDCHPLQFLRELTQNAIEAIGRTPEGEGEIVWDVDWAARDADPTSPYKLCIIDSGIGMTGPEMVRYINQLSSSGAMQAVDGNYGVGAKIAAATRNHAGLVYQSWKSCPGATIHLWRDPETGQYGLRHVSNGRRKSKAYGNVADSERPSLVDEHGTKIVLHGLTPQQDTMRAPAEIAASPRWIAKYLNSRYFRIPEGVRIRAREGWYHPRRNRRLNKLRTITGQEAYLAKQSLAQGRVKLAGAVAHWWILRSDKYLEENASFIESAGHCAALHGEELYELQSGRAGHARLQQFGIIFGQRQVVIYVEPRASRKLRITSNTARTHLLANSEPLPWADWAAEFRRNMPAEVDEFMQQIAAKAADSDHVAAVRERLRPMINLFKVSRYRPLEANGMEPWVIPSNGNGFANGNGKTRAKNGRGKKAAKNCRANGKKVDTTFLRSPAKARPKPEGIFPAVRWVSAIDGTRDAGDIEDKAARYLPDQKLLLINADFRVFTDMIKHWIEQYAKEHGDSLGLREYIRDAVHDWYEQALTETVIGVRALKGSREWSRGQIDDALSEETLTAVVMQRYHPYNAVKRQLGARIGSLKPR